MSILLTESDVGRWLLNQNGEPRQIVTMRKAEGIDDLIKRLPAGWPEQTP
jgi:hypothetical protein